jgi:serine/threonine-protein kinase
VLLDGKGRAFLTDFGIAVGDLAQRSTMTGFSVGTPHYMSPEQIQTPGELTARGGHRSDIYSFGVVLFEMLTGRVPFGGKADHDQTYQIQRDHCEKLPPSPRELNANVSPAIESVVLRCLAKHADERPQSCADLLQQLEAAVLGTPAAALAPPKPRRAATVMEGAIAGPGAAVTTPPAPLPMPPRRGANPRLAWLAVGALVIVGSVSYVVLTTAGPPAQSEAPQPTPPKPDPSTPPQPPGPGRQGDDPRRRGSAQEGRGQSPPAQVQVPPVKVVEADAHYKNGLRYKSQSNWCDAKAEADEAIKVVTNYPGYYPNLPEYRELQKQGDEGCKADNAL